MTDKNRSRPKIDDAINPYDGKAWTVTISAARIDKIGQRTHEQLTLAYTVTETLRHPRLVLREGSEGLIYVARPDAYYPAQLKGAQANSAPYGEVFMVFVDESDENLVHDWKWHKADPTDPDWPNGYTGFQKIL